MASELLEDPGFEGDLSAWQPIDAAVATGAADTAIVYSGAQAMRVDYIASGRGGVEMTVYGLEVNQTYRVAVWIFCPQGSGGLAPSIRVHWDATWSEAPLTWEEHPEAWVSYSLQSSSFETPLTEGVWSPREVIFAAPQPWAHLQIYNAADAVAGQSFNVDEASFAINEPRLPSVYCELASDWTTLPVVNVIGEDFSDGMQSYHQVDHFEPDKLMPIDPATYAGIQEDYTSYSEILSNTSLITKVVRVDPDGIESPLQYAMPIPIVHGGFRLIDIEAPLDVYFHYDLEFDNGPAMSTQQCIVPSYTISTYAGMRCSPVLLSDPLIASQSMWVGLLSIDALTHPGRRELFDVISRHYPVGLSDMRMAPRTTIKYVTTTLDTRTEFLTLVRSGRVLLMRIPDTSYPEAYWYISVGDITEERIIHFDHRRPERRWTLDVAVVERPYGLISLDSNRVYNDVMVYEPDGVTAITPQTYQGLLFDYTDYTSVLTGTSMQVVTSGSGGLLSPSSSSDLGQWVLVRS